MTQTILKKTAGILDSVSVEEQQWATFFAQMGIPAKKLEGKQGVYELGMPGRPIFKLFGSLSELRKSEKTLEAAADSSQRPVIGALPFNSFGATTYVPGVGPVPCVMVKAGAIHDDWALSGHRLMNQLIVTLRSEFEALQAGEQSAPYITYLMRALEQTEVPQTLEELTKLCNAAAEHPQVIGLPAALQAAAGRGSHQGIFMFNPERKWDTTSSLPAFKKDDWFLYDLSRAIADETSSTRRAHGFIHQCLITAIEMEQNLFVSYRVNDGVKKELTKVRKQLQLS